MNVNTNTEPVAIGAAVVIVANAIIVMLTALNVWSLSDTQQASVMGVITAAVVLATSIWARSKVTPVVEPHEPEHAAE